MNYLAQITGTYRSRTRVNLLLFWISLPWKTQTFSFSRLIAVPDLKYVFDPIKNIPLGAALAVKDGQATVSLELLGQDVPIQSFELNAGLKHIQWSPIKGVEIDALATFAPVAGK